MRSLGDMQALFASRAAVVFFIFALLFAAAPQALRAQVPNVGATGATSGSCPTLSRDLERGMSGADVQQLQQFLVAGGHLSQADFATGPGTFGGRTKAAVIRFQAGNGVPATGYVGPLTRAAIQRVCGGGGGGLPAGVSMSAAPTSGNAPLNVVFTIKASSAYCGNYSLDFGDGDVEDLKNFCGTRTLSHTYNGQGTRTARLERVVGSSRTQVALVNIGTGSGPVTTPSCTMTLSRNTVVKGATTTVSWTSSGATKATWDDGTETGTSGSQELQNLTASTTKSITFRGEGGTKKCSVTVAVTAPPSGTVAVTGNATANGSVAELPTSGQSAYKLAEFQLKTDSKEAVVMKKLVFTLRNQTSDRAPGAAKVSGYRVTVGTATFSVSTAVNGLNETGTVALGSGVTIPANQSIGVAIFADIVPNSGGHLDLWIYPADTEFTGVTSGAAITPTSQVTNRVDASLLYWSGWIAVRTPASASPGQAGGISGDCILDGVGYAAEDAGNCQVWTDGAGDAVPGGQQNQCRKFTDGSLQCTTYGWVGSATREQYGVNLQGTRVACLSSNGIFVPGGRSMYGYCPYVDGVRKCPNNYGTIYYTCQSDGWWVIDSVGNKLSKPKTSPEIDPASFGWGQSGVTGP